MKKVITINELKEAYHKYMETGNHEQAIAMMGNFLADDPQTIGSHSYLVNVKLVDRDLYSRVVLTLDREIRSDDVTALSALLTVTMNEQINVVEYEQISVVGMEEKNSEAR